MQVGVASRVLSVKALSAGGRQGPCDRHLVQNILLDIVPGQLPPSTTPLDTQVLLGALLLVT